MRIGIVGGGGAGLLCARLLATQHDVSLFESDDRIGGNARSHLISDETVSSRVDLGVNLFHIDEYPLFMSILKVLQIETRPCNLSIEFQLADRLRFCFDYNRGRLAGAPVWGRFFKSLTLRHQISKLRRIAENMPPTACLGDLLNHSACTESAALALRGMAMGVWTMRSMDLDEFPLSFVLNQLRQLGLLTNVTPDRWHFIPKGFANYLDRLAGPISNRIFKECPIESVTRSSEGIRLTMKNGAEVAVDEVIMAVPGHRLIDLMKTPSDTEYNMLARLKSAVHHISLKQLSSDTRNLRFSPAIQLTLEKTNTGGFNAIKAVTHLNRLTHGVVTQNLGLYHSSESKAHLTDKATLYNWAGYTPIFSRDSVAVHKLYDTLSGRDRIHFCGSYWGNGLHEAAVGSALQICRKFGIDLAALDS